MFLGWYPDDIFSAIPIDCIEVTDETYKQAIKINANYYNSETKKFEVKDFRTKNQIEEENLRTKKNEAYRYLKDTDWVSTYKIRHDLGLELIPEDSSKWEVLSKREEYITFLKGI